jgi:aspartyl-tRNA(Asn)/glutamyl-tRNA(Gln) amidotransferase subunit A
MELTATYLDRVERLNPTLGAYITVMSETARAEAAAAEDEIGRGLYRGPLHGIPVAIKDIIYTQGVLTSAGSRVLADHVPAYDSTIVERLRASGAVLLGKLNLSEFAVGGTIDHPFGTPRNPWDLGRSAGGSSSGSAVAVAGGLCAGSLGSDTGGSIRGPSAFCGTVGLRPTYGRVTRHGVVPMSWSLDTVGPMTRTVEDCAIMLQAIAGHDERDSSSSSEPVPDYAALLGDRTDTLRVALPRAAFEYEGLESDVRTGVVSAVDSLAELGADIDEVSLPVSAHSGAVFLATADVDAATFHMDWLKTQGDLYDWSTRTRLESAALTPATTYIRAQRARTLIRDELMTALEDHDVIVMPASPTLAPPIAQSTGSPGGYYQGRLDLGRRQYTSPAALAGLPAISVPCGFSDSGLPIGVQIIGRPFAEADLLRVAHRYEQAAGWSERRAPEPV